MYSLLGMGTETRYLIGLWSQDICKYDYKMNMRQNYSMSNFIISRFNTYMFYQIKRTALLESIPLIDVSIHIGIFEHKADIKDQKLLISCRSLAYNHSSKSMTPISSFEILSPAFNAANSNCCLFLGVSAFTLLFSW